MTLFDSLVVALLEGLLEAIFLTPGRLISRAWGIHREHRWSWLATTAGTVLFWAGIAHVAAFVWL